MVILRGVLEVQFTKYRSSAWGKPGEDGKPSRLWTGFSTILDLEPYMLQADLGKIQKLLSVFDLQRRSNNETCKSENSKTTRAENDRDPSDKFLKIVKIDSLS